MTYAIMLGVFVVLLFLGAPIALSLGMSSLLAILYNGTGINVVAGQIYGGIGKYLLLAVPFFVLSGNIMAKAGISDRLIAFIDALLGHLRGGIAMVCIVVACFFGAISGSGAATVAALGVILIPAMIEREKFSDPFAHGVVAAASSIAVIIPPSISFVIYASLTGVSVGDIFVAGILPGVIMGAAMILVVQIYAHKHHLKPAHPWKGWREVWRTFKSAFWGLLMPVIILGGIYGGYFSATEAAAVAAVYGLFVGTVVYKELKWKDIVALLYDTAKSTGGAPILVSTYESWGVDYTTAAWAEVYTGLQTKLYDGQENPIAVADASSIQEVQKYVTAWTANYGIMFMAMNGGLYNSLSDELIDLPRQWRRGSGGIGMAERHVRRQRDGSGACFFPLLACFAVRVTHIGPRGSGYAAKLINNLLVAIGRRANTESLHLDAGQIKNDRGRIIVNDKMETSVPGVYAIGDCVFGRAQLAHTASAMGEAAAENIMGIPAVYDERTNPTCVYMEPEAASVGLTEEQCRAQGIDYKVGKFPMSANGKALILNGGEGLVKIIAGKEYGESLGMHIIGPRATDLICEGALAIGGEMTLDELIATIHSHPTVTETIREAALSAEKRAIHIKN